MEKKLTQEHTHTEDSYELDPTQEYDILAMLEDGGMPEHDHGHMHSHTHDHEHSHDHSHDHTDNHAHGHSHGHGHGHTHSHEHTKAVLNRLSRTIGHLQSIKRMIEDGRDCSEVLIQLSAVKAAINNTGKVILQDHIQHCLVDAIESGDMQAIEELNTAIDRFIK